MNKTIINMFAGAALVLPAFAISQDVPASRPAENVSIDKKAAESKPAAKKAPPNIYDEKADATQQIAGALKKAKEENRRVLIQWGANWCGWCHLLHDVFKKDKNVARELLYEYSVVLVDIGKLDKNMELAEKYNADLKKSGVPYLTILDASGKVLANEETTPLEAKTSDGKNGHDAVKVLNLLKGHRAEALNADVVFQEALSLAKKEDKALFLKFGAPWCGYCHILDDWMKRPEVAAILTKDFVTTKVDVDRMTGGNELLQKYCKAGGGLPQFVFLTKDGGMIADSNGPKGNVGCPLEPDEIAWFQEMVKKAKVKITDADIAEMGRTLAEEKEKLSKKAPR
ncbi:MAG: thioredoxin family protein [Planctomycetota bacterium]